VVVIWWMAVTCVIVVIDVWVVPLGARSCTAVTIALGDGVPGGLGSVERIVVLRRHGGLYGELVGA